MFHRNDRWTIQLGDDHWRRHTVGRPEVADLRFLGSVARGAQFGALAETVNGLYVQVNGDHIAPLSQGQLRRAVEMARGPRNPIRPMQRRASQAAPVVTIKPRRKAFALLPD